MEIKLADWLKIAFLINIQIMSSTHTDGSANHRAQKSGANNLTVQYKFTSRSKLYLNPFQRHLETPTSGLQRTQLRYSLSIIEQIVSSVANQRTAFVIECQQIYTKTRQKHRAVARAVDVMMAQAKRIYILIIKVNKLFSFFRRCLF